MIDPGTPPGAAQLPAGISLCMIVRDEERFLEGALSSVAGVVDEMCIVDTGSRDGTLAIAERFGARIECVTWRDDFAWARNRALAMATRRWILVLDADERLSDASRDALRRIGTSPAALRGGWIRCRNLTDDYHGSGAMSNALVRIFPNDGRIRYRNPIHEFVTLDGRDGGLDAAQTAIEIEHHGYLKDVVGERRKGERNLRLSESAVEREPGDPYHWFNLGMASLLAGDDARARTALETMRRLTAGQPRGFRPHGLVTLAELYVRGGDALAALDAADEALRGTPHYPNAHFVRGKILASAGRLFDAREAFGAALAAGARAGEAFVVDDEIAIWKAHSEIGATLMRETRFDDALRWFDLALAARPDAEPLLVNRAKCLEALGRHADAGAAYEAAYRRHNGERASVEFVNYLLRRGESRRALAVIDVTVANLPAETAITVLGTAVAVALAAGDGGRADWYLDSALDRAPDEHSGFAMLGELYDSLLGGGPARDLLRRRLACRTLRSDDRLTPT